VNPGRVAYLCADPGIPPDSSKGASVHFRAMARAFAAIGVDLDVFMTRKGSVDPFLPHRGLVVPTPREKGVAGEVLQFAHSHTVLEAMARQGPHSAVYERMSLFSAAGLAYARQQDIPFVVEVNAPLWIEAAQFRSLHLGRTAEALCIDVLCGADAVFAVSSELARMLVQAGTPAERVHVLGNGADLAAFDGVAARPRPQPLVGKPLLLFAGSLKPWHGVDFLLDGFRALRAERECGLWVIGDGPARAQVEAAAAEMPDDIVCEGAIAHEDMGSYLAAADAICAPYTSASPAYFSPLKIVEAIAARRPVIASRVPCVLAELSRTDLPGLFEPDSIEDFVAACRRVLDDPEVATAHDLVQGLDWTDKAQVVAPWLRGNHDSSGGGHDD
jgi:glycosyltransferase involved in cell wall biosynthesis